MSATVEIDLSLHDGAIDMIADMVVEAFDKYGLEPCTGSYTRVDKNGKITGACAAGVLCLYEYGGRLLFDPAHLLEGNKTNWLFTGVTQGWDAQVERYPLLDVIAPSTDLEDLIKVQVGCAAGFRAWNRVHATQ